MHVVAFFRNSLRASDILADLASRQHLECLVAAQEWKKKARRPFVLTLSSFLRALAEPDLVAVQEWRKATPTLVSSYHHHHLTF
jgi:hypothetical protein